MNEPPDFLVYSLADSLLLFTALEDAIDVLNRLIQHEPMPGRGPDRPDGGTGVPDLDSRR